MLTANDLPPPDIIDKLGAGYTTRTVNDFAKKLINTNNFFYPKAKKMTDDYDRATELVEKAQSNFDRALNKLNKTEAEISISAKKVSEKVRQSTQKLNDGLARIEKQANFDRLEKYVELLERADKAISSLAELESSGRLERIASAIK